MYSAVDIRSRPDLFARLAEEFNFDNVPLLAAAGAAYTIGYLQYYYAIRLSLREGRGPYPLWMHLFYLAHDSSWSVLLHRAAARYDGHWFFWATSWALALWSALEVFCIYRAIFVEGEDLSEDQLRRHDRGWAVWTAAVFLLNMYGVVHLGIALMGGDCLMSWFALTNVVMLLGTAAPWMRRGSRDGLSVSLAIVNVACAIFTFSPFSMWVISTPEVFDNDLYYMFGAVMCMLAVNNLVTVLRYPPKVARKGQKTPIW